MRGVKILSPAARSLLGESIDLNLIKGSGKDGRIMKEDAVSFLLNKNSNPKQQEHQQKKISPITSPQITNPSLPTHHLPKKQVKKAEEYWLQDDRGHKDIPLTMMRKVIATRLTESKNAIPHVYANIEANIDLALETRNQLKKLGISSIPSLNDLIVKACALALIQVPSMNVRLENDGQIKPNSSVDISVAVATPTGLITPIIDSADTLSPMEISMKMKDLAARAKENKLKPQEYQGGSFTVSNLGMFQIDDFTAIINLPQVAILAIGSGKKQLFPLINEKRKEIPLDDVNKASQTTTMMNVTLSFNPRAVNEIQACTFLKAFQSYIESPVVLFS